ncbi:MAG: hypothetical protein PHS17_11440, partial [Desulfobacterales bacterium]|nr:hypothetical protein [Desulfobacterales bacterium]
MKTALLDILSRELLIDEERIAKIKSLDSGDESSFAGLLRTKGILEESVLLRAFSILLGLDIMDRIPAHLIDTKLASPFSVSYLKQKKAIPLRKG